MFDTGAVNEITYNPLKLRPQILTISLVFVVLAILMIVYFVKLRKVQPKQAPKGYVLGVQLYVAYMRSLTVDILGPKFEALTPYFSFLFAYILLSNITGVLGLDNPTASLTVTLSMGLVTFVGMFVIGFKVQKLSYLKKFCFCISTKKGKKIPVFINTLEVISQIAPLVSISVRLWGNIFAGGLISTLWLTLTGYVWSKIPLIGAFNLLGGITLPVINAYFDLLCGLIQALVFTMLTMMYWRMQIPDEEYEKQIQIEHNNIKVVNGNINAASIKQNN